MSETSLSLLAGITAMVFLTGFLVGCMGAGWVVTDYVVSTGADTQKEVSVHPVPDGVTPTETTALASLSPPTRDVLTTAADSGLVRRLQVTESPDAMVYAEAANITTFTYEGQYYAVTTRDAGHLRTKLHGVAYGGVFGIGVVVAGILLAGRD